MSPEWLQMMARYNAWQNNNIVGCADRLSDQERMADRGAFFGSIMGTLSHTLWGEFGWMAVFDGGATSDCSIADSGTRFTDWNEFKGLRLAMDRRISKWADSMDADGAAGDLVWRWSPNGAENRAAKDRVFTNLFTHSTQHRGQVHAMLTSIGAKPGDTDLFLLPAEGAWL
ncbi:MAG: putative damage-inducible protein DinB [Paracoccaceae bacterium]|jgi:uncharacterized damage-inducible protein DinB